MRRHDDPTNPAALPGDPHALADRVLGSPAAEPRDRHQAVLPDSPDDQPDLIRMREERDQPTGTRASDAGDRRAEDVGA